MPRDETSAPPRDSRLAAGLLLATLATGVGWLALLPPFEGFDETAHYSSVQELADTGRLPVLGHSFLSTDVVAYRASWPTPYRDRPPFEFNGGITYRDFFAGGHDALREAPGAARRFASSRQPNWQAQHPPLYYALLVPLYHLTRDWSWPAHLFVLRLASWLAAVGGLWLAARATRRYLERVAPGRPELGVVPLAWPFLIPMFFPTLARLGNDSLCLLLLGLAWRHLLAMELRLPSRRDGVVLGLILGAGLLTKAHFVPVVAAVAAFLLARRRWRTTVIALPLATVVGGAWSVYAASVAGGFVVSADFPRLLAQGGPRLLVERFDALELAKGSYWTLASFVWGGTWSLAHVSEWWRLPAVGLPPLVLGCVVAGARRRRLDPGAWLALLLLAAFGVALTAYEVMKIAITGSGGGTPGWYVHVLAGPLGLLLALGLDEASRWWWLRALLAGLFAWVTAFFATVCVLQLALYTGCAAKLGRNNHYSFPDGPGCLLDVASLGERAAVLGFPLLGLPLLSGGLATGTVLVARLLRHVAAGARAEAA